MAICIYNLLYLWRNARFCGEKPIILTLVMRKYPIVALIYDFDGTLSPGNMQEFGFIQAIGKKPQEFWQQSDEIAADQDASNILSYMKLMYDEARKAGIKLRREDFKTFGASVELFPGVREWFRMINDYGRSKGVKVEHYINSSNASLHVRSFITRKGKPNGPE